MADIVRLLRVMFGSVEEAVRHNRNRRAVDQVFSLIFKSLSGESVPANQTHTPFPLVKAAVNQSLRHPRVHGSLARNEYVQYLPLSNEIMMRLSGIMTDFESADFVDMSDNFYGCRRSYTILGSSLFYKGYLICNHMSRDNLYDLHLYLSHHALLTLTSSQKISRLVIWREIFPTKFCYEVSGMNNTFGYSEPYARWFLLVVGLKHGLFAVVLEAGGCASQIENKSRPDPFYINQAFCALMQTQTSDIIQQFELRLSGFGLPQTANFDNFVSNTTEEINLGVLPTEQRTGSLAVTAPRDHHRKSSIDSDLYSNNSAEGIIQNSKRQRMFPDIVNRIPRNGIEIIDHVATKLDAGAEKSVFHYCHLNSSEGLFITSPNTDCNSDLLQSFDKCCIQIHDMFNIVSSHKTLLDQEEEPVFYPDSHFISAREQGVLFHGPSNSNNRKQKRSSNYWVVGRKYQRPMKQEIFVCFHESTSQNVVEMAFRLGFGLFSPD